MTIHKMISQLELILGAALERMCALARARAGALPEQAGADAEAAVGGRQPEDDHAGRPPRDGGQQPVEELQVDRDRAGVVARVASAPLLGPRALLASDACEVLLVKRAVRERLLNIQSPQVADEGPRSRVARAGEEGKRGLRSVGQPRLQIKRVAGRRCRVSAQSKRAGSVGPAGAGWRGKSRWARARERERWRAQWPRLCECSARSCRR